MVLFQMDTTRFIQVYIAQGLICVYFLLLAYKILSHKRQHLNIFLSCSFIFAAGGFIINFIYAPLTDESIVLILYYLTIFCIELFPVFLLIFVLMIYESEKVFTPIKGIIILLIYSGALFFMVLIPNGVTINADTEWKPVWSWFYFLYVISIATIGFVFVYIYAVKIYREFKDEELRKKWKIFIIGLILVYVFNFGTLLSNTLNMQTYRNIWSIISLILVFVAPYLIYYGVGKQIRKEEV